MESESVVTGIQANGGSNVEWDTSPADASSSGAIDLRCIINPLVDLIYWRDLKKTAVVFGAFLALLISLAYVSLIFVVSYTSLIVLTVTIIYRVYKNIMQAIQKPQDGHPFKSLLELDTDLPQEKARDFSDAFVNWFNPVFSEIKRLFLVEDLVDCQIWLLALVSDIRWVLVQRTDLGNPGCGSTLYSPQGVRTKPGSD
ncbi:hypothetical protein OTU49_000048 [Cherax quadricarinatus]|uniref:Reticulon-like protein n=1 Tax=Cherax quadricarinatus TaxID=27406 RepID=A0AAW0Y1I8_CHEQU